MKIPNKILLRVKHLCLIFIPAIFTAFMACEERDDAYTSVEKGLIQSKTYNDYLFGVTIDTSSRILGAGVTVASDTNQSDFAVMRVLTSGALDTSFHTDGKANNSFDASIAAASSIEVLSDGKILVMGTDVSAGGTKFAAQRYLSDGVLDTSFNTTGKVSYQPDAGNYQVTAGAARSDGSFVMVAYTNNIVARFLSSGNLDTAFNTYGYKKIIVGSSTFDGASSVINGPNSSYYVTFGHCDDQDPGAGVSCEWTGYVSRLTSSGKTDAGFNSGSPIACGAVVDNGFRALALDSSGKVLAAGYEGSNRFLVCRFKTNGQIDTVFGTGGIATSSVVGGSSFVRGISIQTDGKIVASGYSILGTSGAFMVARYRSSGFLDTTFGTDGVVLTSFGTTGGSYLLNGAYGLNSAVFPDGKILVAGEAFNGSNADFAFAIYWP